MGLTVNTNVDAMSAYRNLNITSELTFEVLGAFVFGSSYQLTLLMTLQASRFRRTFRARSAASSKLPPTLKTASAFFRPLTALLPKPRTCFSVFVT